MTTIAPTPAAPAVRPAVRRRPRWLRIVVPLGLVALFWLIGFGAHAYQQPRVADGGTLSPDGTGRHGSSLLAQRLEEQGVRIIRVTSSAEALEAAQGTDATLFVPAPDLLNGRLLDGLVGMQGLHRIVLARPGVIGRALFVLPFDVEQRWATATVEPDCREPYAAAGAAGVGRDRYLPLPEIFGPVDGVRCYGGSLVDYRLVDVRITVVGATDPFRNDRFAEAGNAALATALLSEQRDLIWLDIHRSEIQLGPFKLPDYGRGDQDRTSTGDPLWDAFPELLWVAVVLVLAAGALFAVARSRRLGPPVAEPLPVLVPAAEAVLGRGRLYRRIRAREASLETLRAAALARIARALDPLSPAPERALTSPGPARDAFVRTIALRTRADEASVSAVLFGPAPETDDALVRATADLDQLVAAVLSGSQPHQSGGES